jgi:hypothetical protein
MALAVSVAAIALVRRSSAVVVGSASAIAATRSTIATLLLRTILKLLVLLLDVGKEVFA